MQQPSPPPYTPRRTRLRWRLQSLALGAFWQTMRRLPPTAAARAGRALFGLLGPLSGKQRFVLRNLKLAFPQHGCAEIAALARGVWRNFGTVLAEYPHLPHFFADVGDNGLDIRVAPELRAVLAGGQPAVYVAAHLANWEIATGALVRLGVAMSVVYAPQRNPHVDAMLQARRAAAGCRFVGKRNAVRRLVAELEAGRSVGLLPDQRADAGELLPFFGRPAQTALSPAWLALRFGRPLVPVRVERTAPGRYRVSLLAPLDRGALRADRAGVMALSRQLNAVFESWIRERPEQWLCMRRRWPAADMARALAADEGLQPCT